MVSLVGDVRAVVEEMALGEPAIVGHSLGASIAAVYAAAHGARAVVCVESRCGSASSPSSCRRTPRTCAASARWRPCCRSTTLSAQALHGGREHRAQGACVSSRGRPWNLGRAAENPSRATDRDRRGDPAPNCSTTPIAARLAATTGLRGLAYGPRAQRARRDLGRDRPHASPRRPGTVCGTRAAATHGPIRALNAPSDRRGSHGRDSGHASTGSASRDRVGARIRACGISARCVVVLRQSLSAPPGRGRAGDRRPRPRLPRASDRAVRRQHERRAPPLDRARAGRNDPRACTQPNARHRLRWRRR